MYVPGTELTQRVCIIEFEAAEHLVGVPGVEEPVASHHDLETLCETDEQAPSVMTGNLNLNLTHAKQR